MVDDLVPEEGKRARETYLVESEITTPERSCSGCRFYWSSSAGTFGCHLLPRLVLVPFLALLLPFDQCVDLIDSFLLVDLAHIDSALKQSVHV